MTEIVKVIIRQRTSSHPDQESAIRHCDLVKNRIFVEDRPFTVGQVLNQTATQEDVYASIEPMVKKFLEGDSCNVIAYGQSGTGKSYTMGLQSDNFQMSNCGIVPRALREIMESTSNPGNETVVEISFLEIYNEKVYDLLSGRTDEQINTKGSKFTGGVKKRLRNLCDAELQLMEGNKNRRTRPTTMNTNSSRSHGIVVIYQKTKDSFSTFHMVDLAGSEGVRRTGHKGEALAEGSHINRGLLGISNIFKALSDGSGHVPYRDTVLGSVLLDSLNLKGFSTLVICISPMKMDVSETINSLTFAQKAVNMKVNPKVQYMPENKKKKNNESFSITHQENFDTPIAMKRPLATSTAQRPKYRPNPHKNADLQTPIAPLTNRSINPQLADLQSSQLMQSPTVKEIYDTLQRTLRKKNIRINSIRYSEMDRTSDNDSGEFNSTVIENVPMKTATKNPVTSSSDHHQFVRQDKLQDEVIRIMEARFANLTAVASLPQPPHPEIDSAIFDLEEISRIELENGEDDVTSNLGPVTGRRLTFNFKVPEVPVLRTLTHDHQSIRMQQNEQESTVSTNRRRSVRIQEVAEQSNVDNTVSTNRRRSFRIQQIAEKRVSIAPKVPSPIALKRRRTTINKKARRQSIMEDQVLTKAEHCKNVLSLLNKGDMKAIQMLPQIGMKTAYGIINHRSLNGKFKSFEDVAAAPFWRGKGWERFAKINNLV